MSDFGFQDILDELEALRLIDPHTHINPHSAASATLGDIMGYHYYTELAHSAGMPKDQLESASDAKEMVSRLVPWMATIRNTAQYSWLMEMCRTFFHFEEEDLTESNWEALFDSSKAAMADASWESHVLDVSGLDQVYLTNDFDDPLDGFDTSLYVPCLRTDDLVFHLTQETVRERLRACSGVEIADAETLRKAIAQRFEHFCSRGARACAISLPPDFTPAAVASPELNDVVRRCCDGETLSVEDRALLSQGIFFMLAEYCDQHRLPFDLMIGVNRSVYPGGVFQGRDLFDHRVSLRQYAELFNSFPKVMFPVSVLAETSNQELVSYSWIFPNVITSGHWWYSNIPVYIARDCRARLQAVPRTKQIGYYSDMYKLEFALPKFGMYRRILARVLSEDFVRDRGWSVVRAVELGKQVLRGNVETIFGN